MSDTAIYSSVYTHVLASSILLYIAIYSSVHMSDTAIYSYI